MEQRILATIVVVALAVVGWMLNESFNPVPILKQVLQFIIIICSIIAVLHYSGLLGSL